MAKYIIIRQDVFDDVDDVDILQGTYNTLDEANDKLQDIYADMYEKYQVKLINRDYLFCWKGSYFEGRYKFNKRIYFRIKEIR